MSHETPHTVTTSSPSPGFFWQAPIKINLFLHINRRRSDGYHDLQTYFQLLDYGDRLFIKPRESPELHVDWCAGDQSIDARPEPQEDLVYRAAQLLRHETGHAGGATIRVEKNAPIGGGVGGGSASAATVMLALNRLWSLDLPEAALLRLARSLGADVPIFIHGHSAWAEGTGDRFHDYRLPGAWYVVVVPDDQIATASLFAAPKLKRDTAIRTPAQVLPDWRRNGTNAFEPLLLMRSARIRACYEELRAQAGFARVTGSGACLFTPVASQAEGIALAAKLIEPKRVIVCSTLNRDIAQPLAAT